MRGKMREERCKGERETAQVSSSVGVAVVTGKMSDHFYHLRVPK